VLAEQRHRNVDGARRAHHDGRHSQQCALVNEVATRSRGCVGCVRANVGERGHVRSLRVRGTAVLLGASPRVQPHSGASISDSPRATRICAGHDQSSVGRRSAHRVRGSRRRSSEPRAGSWHLPGERGAADRCTTRELADTGAAPTAPRSYDAVEPTGTTGPGDGRHADWLRRTSRRVVGPAAPVNSTTRRSLGHCGPGRKGRTRPHGSHSQLSEEPYRRVDSRGWHHARARVPRAQQGRPHLGRRHIAKGAVGCGARRCGSRRHRLAGPARPAAHVRTRVGTRSSPGSANSTGFGQRDRSGYNGQGPQWPKKP